ncbi:hypothetical protein [Paenibacillus donghaensis]|uniref:Resolvase/invertase-type recombinase catalytic domain-containing protein n=1 Tax=Paenibacillus donghaensis TaxID=414771 RepID=A0A2Z2KMI8_9BACL|nr:hypothetical protein [Paenibacillus donghaensis]ASA25625.1 hypothetical protein B9T62_35770 [Paenibacillus donghaensis]
MRIGYLRAKRKKELEEFLKVVDIEEVYFDLTDEFSFSVGTQLSSLLQKLTSADKLTIRGLKDVADNVAELSSFLRIIQNASVDLNLLDEADGSMLLSPQGIEGILYLEHFIKSKDEIQALRSKKLGRPLQNYPDGFYETYLSYCEKESKAADAALRLGVSEKRFYQMVRLFEV